MFEKLGNAIYLKTGVMLPRRGLVMLVVLGISILLFIGSLIFHFSVFGLGGSTSGSINDPFPEM